MKIKIAIIILVFASVVFFTANHLGINSSDSVDFTLYWHSDFAAVSLGHYYVVNYQGDEYSGLITKRAACLPYSIISRADEAFFCNGTKIASIEITHDAAGNAFPQYSPPQGGLRLQDEVFFLGDTMNSYDSRYFGLLPISSIQREVTPIW